MRLSTIHEEGPTSYNRMQRGIVFVDDRLQENWLNTIGKYAAPFALAGAVALGSSGCSPKSGVSRLGGDIKAAQQHKIRQIAPGIIKTAENQYLVTATITYSKFAEKAKPGANQNRLKIAAQRQLINFLKSNQTFSRTQIDSDSVQIKSNRMTGDVILNTGMNQANNSQGETITNKTITLDDN